MANNNRNSLLVPGAENAIEKFKLEVASEIGLHNYDTIDKGFLMSRQNGYVGGNMTRKMVNYAQQVMSQQGHETISNATQGRADIPNEIKQLNEMASQNFNNFVQTIYGLQQSQMGGNQEQQSQSQFH